MLSLRCANWSCNSTVQKKHLQETDCCIILKTPVDENLPQNVRIYKPGTLHARAQVRHNGLLNLLPRKPFLQTGRHYTRVHPQRVNNGHSKKISSNSNWAPALLGLKKIISMVQIPNHDIRKRPEMHCKGAKEDERAITQRRLCTKHGMTKSPGRLICLLAYTPNALTFSYSASDPATSYPVHPTSLPCTQE